MDENIKSNLDLIL